MFNRIPGGQMPVPMPKGTRTTSAFRPCHEIQRAQQIPPEKTQ